MTEGASRTRRLALLALKVGVSALLVAYIVWWLARKRLFGTLGETLRGAGAGWLLTAFALQVLGTFVAAWRWLVLLRAQALRMPYRSLLNSYFVAAFFNNFLPGMAGGDVVRMVDSARHTRETTRSVAVVVLGRIAGLVAQVLLAGAAVLVFWRTVMGERGLYRPLFVFLGAFALGLVALFGLAVPAVARLVMRLFGHGPVKKVLATVLDTLSAYRRRPGHTLAVLGVSLVFQFNVVVYYYFCAKALSIPVPLYRMTMGMAVVQVLMMVVPSVNSIGVRTVAFQQFVFVGVSAEAALAWAASLEVCDLALRLGYGLVGLAVFLLRGRNRKALTF